jgi:hypothetical protein
MVEVHGYRLAGVYGAWFEDLEQRGPFASTIVLVMGEFGRTPHLNSKHGRDHWPACRALALGGGGLRGGQVVGRSNERGAQVAECVVSMGDLYATPYKALGIDWHKEYPTGRPVKIANSIARSDWGAHPGAVLIKTCSSHTTWVSHESS